MFGLFKSPTFADPQLGPLARSRGMWRGSITLPGHAPVPLIIAGDKTRPDATAVAEVKCLADEYAASRPAIEAALFDHYGPYGESEPDADAGDASIPKLVESSQVWTNTTLCFVAASPMAGALTLELGFNVAWDPEHTLGARIRAGRLIELNGSVLAP